MKGLNIYLTIGLLLLTASVVGWLVLVLAQFAYWITRIAGVASVPFLLYGFYVQVKGGARELPGNSIRMLDD
jgi:dolichyl-phosphate-mannose--protein O-mannosyl transferase